MLRRRRKGAGASAIISDTKKTIKQMRQLPDDAQRKIAIGVYRDILRSLREIEATPGPSSPERDEVIRHQLVRTKEARHRALNHGATNWSDPEWATAAIVESWLMANSGMMGQHAFDKISGLVTAWLRSILSKSDFEELERI